MALLEVKDLTAAYGGIQALRGVSLKVEEGQIVAVLGANGAGKSTLLKCISSVMSPMRLWRRDLYRCRRRGRFLPS